MENFWKWFADFEGDFRKIIAANRGPETANQLSEGLEQCGLDFAFEFGPGKTKDGTSLSFTPEGDPDKRFLIDYLILQAPHLRGWTFFGSRQAGGRDGMTMKIHDLDFELDQLVIAAEPNEETELFDLVIWHPKFPKTDDEEARRVVTHVGLDDAMGELDAEMWVGSVEIVEEDKCPKGAMPASKLLEFIRREGTARKWEKSSPSDTWSLYKLPEPNEDFPRSDTISGMTAHMNLMGFFLDNKGEIDDPLKGTGAQYVYIAFDSAALPEGEEVNTRNAFEEALDERLRAAKAGRLIGAASGFAGTYLDFIHFDGKKSIEILKNAAREANLPEGARIIAFGSDASWEI